MFGSVQDVVSDGLSVVSLVGPLAGMYVVAKLVLGFQRMVVDGALYRVAQLEDRVEILEEEVSTCEKKNNRLIQALLRAGLQLPE